MQKSSRSLSSSRVPRRTSETPTSARAHVSAFILRLPFDAYSLPDRWLRCFASVAGIRQLLFVSAAADAPPKFQKYPSISARIHAQLGTASAPMRSPGGENSPALERFAYRLLMIHPYKDASELVEHCKYAADCYSERAVPGVSQRKDRYRFTATTIWTRERQVFWLSRPSSTGISPYLLLPAMYFGRALSDQKKERFGGLGALHLPRRSFIRYACRSVPADTGAARPRSQESNSLDKMPADELSRRYETAAPSGSPTAASAAGRRHALREEGGVYLSNDRNMPTGNSSSSRAGDHSTEKGFLPACFASSPTSQSSSVNLSVSHNRDSMPNRAVKAGSFLIRTLPQSLAEAEKWEPSELVLKQKQQVIQWKHSKVCVVCKKEVQGGALEKVESACEKAWRFLNGYARSHRVCPLLTNMRLMQYAEAPLKDRVRFDARLRRK